MCQWTDCVSSSYMFSIHAYFLKNNKSTLSVCILFLHLTQYGEDFSIFYEYSSLMTIENFIVWMHYNLLEPWNYPVIAGFLTHV